MTTRPPARSDACPCRLPSPRLYSIERLPSRVSFISYTSSWRSPSRRRSPCIYCTGEFATPGTSAGCASASVFYRPPSKRRPAAPSGFMPSRSAKCCRWSNSSVSFAPSGPRCNCLYPPPPSPDMRWRRRSSLASRTACFSLRSITARRSAAFCGVCGPSLVVILETEIWPESLSRNEMRRGVAAGHQRPHLRPPCSAAISALALVLSRHVLCWPGLDPGPDGGGRPPLRRWPEPRLTASAPPGNFKYDFSPPCRRPAASRRTIAAFLDAAAARENLDRRQHHASRGVSWRPR